MSDKETPGGYSHVRMATEENETHVLVEPHIKARNHELGEGGKKHDLVASAAV